VKARETRHGVSMAARLRWQGNWLPARVTNISSHGLLLMMQEPPQPGTYVEVYVDAAHVVARTIWATGQLCGLRSRETFDLSGVSSGGIAVASRDPAQRPVPRARSNVRQRESDSRHLSSLIQYVTFAAIAATAASGLAWEMYQTLSAPMSAVHSALDLSGNTKDHRRGVMP
jgi:hypothetical protein